MSVNYAFAAGLAISCASVFAALDPVQPRISGWRLDEGFLRLSWAGGTPDYQVQTCQDLGKPWTNVGNVTKETTLLVPLVGGKAFYRVVQDYTAQYEVMFEATWSALTHPEQFPSGAHWSGLVGGVHNSNVHFWREGEPASDGIKSMAEQGRQTPLLSEVNAAIGAGSAHFTLSGGGIGSSPGSRLLSFPQRMRRDFPLVTLCSMVAPSPDWFVGVDSLSLIENGSWVARKSVTLYGFDAGTDNGPSYASPDQPATPRGVITQFAGFPALVNGNIIPFGVFTFSRID